MYDCIIIGGGIAGVTASLYLKQANKKVLLIEKECIGGSLNKISSINNFPGFSSIEGPEFAINLYNQIDKNQIEVVYDTVLNIEHLDDKNIIKTKSKDYECKYLILATGKEPRKLNLENEDKLLGHGVSYCALCDGNFFKNKEVALIGSGESALKEALYLSNLCSKVYIINKYDKFKSDDSLVDIINSKSNIEIKYNSIVNSLEEDNNMLKGITYTTDNIKYSLPVSGVFVYIGSTPNIFSNLGLKSDKNYILVNNNMETSIDTIYAIGDIIKKDLYQLTNAASEGMIASFNIIKHLNKKEK